MPCKTKSCQSSTGKLRMLRALTPDTPRSPQFQPELPKNQFLLKTRFSRFTNRSLDQCFTKSSRAAALGWRLHGATAGGRVREHRASLWLMPLDGQILNPQRSGLQQYKQNATTPMLLLVNLENQVFHKNCFVHDSYWNWGGLWTFLSDVGRVWSYMASESLLFDIWRWIGISMH